MSDVITPRPDRDRPTPAQLRAELERVGGRGAVSRRRSDGGAAYDDDVFDAGPYDEDTWDDMEEPRRKGRGGRIVLRILLILVLIAALLIAALLLLYPSYVVYGGSMAPALEEGDLVIAASDRSPAVGDLVAFRSGERVLIKRVAGCPGDTVEVRDDGSVLLNGKALSEPWAILSPGSAGELDYPVTLPEDGYFLLGDNRQSSIDSRSRVLGVIDEDQLAGRLVLRLWPLNRVALLAPDALPSLLRSVGTISLRK